MWDEKIVLRRYEANYFISEFLFLRIFFLFEIILIHADSIALVTMPFIYGPWREKTGLRCFRESKTQTSLLRYRDELEI